MITKSAIRRSAYFYKVFLGILFTSILPVLVMNIISFSFTTREIQDELVKAYMGKMDIASESVDMIFDQIIEGCRLIAQDTIFPILADLQESRPIISKICRRYIQKRICQCWVATYGLSQLCM